MVELEKSNVYVISHGRPALEQRKTCEFLTNANIKYYITMNEGQVEDYIKNGVPESQIVISTNKFEEEYFKKYRTYNVDFHGAICNREMCNIHAKNNGKKYAFQFDDNIVQFSLGRQQTKKTNIDEFCKVYLPNMLKIMEKICESTNIGYMGMNLSAVPVAQKRLIRNGYAYSAFIENLEANIHWRGPFDDDVLHNLDFYHSGKYTNAIITPFAYGKESKSNTGMRKKYKEFAAQRPLGTVNLYPEYVDVGIAHKANGKDKRVYHVFKKSFTNNIKIKDKALFDKTVNFLGELTTQWLNYNNLIS